VRWVVGDVQGCARELDDLLQWVRFDPDRDELWSLGDLVNRGPDSLASLELWRDVGGRGVLGNHDVYTLLAHARRRTRKADTLDTLFRAAHCDALLSRLREQPLLVHLAGDENVRPVWIVHAGLHPQWNDLTEVARRVNAAPHDDDRLEQRDVKFATTVRCCSEDGERCSASGPPENCAPPFKPWDDFYRGRERVVHGHWAARGAYRGPRTMGLDSGCVYGGALSAWCQEEDRVVQVPSRDRGGPIRDIDAQRLPSYSPRGRIR
jgi:bis(5'-nucleosyl)-tetraphosphatase (symmetrical)